MRLTKGITGLDAQHLLQQDLRSFQSMVYHLVTSEPRAKALEFVDDPNNVYMSATIQLEDEQLIILHHRLTPYIAFATGEDNLAFVFTTKTYLHKYFPMRKCLEADVLNTSLEKDKQFHNLSDREWEFVSHFRSEKIGDVMFNCWD
ncbi:hypothetical protein ACIQ2D_13850 [Lysinibacillus sp. NPDC097287]|uniref:hypothetical protein n=1 Tax=Lysinibacillus sp. NPDC097287 TaxID=3364144 RepID=UPI00381B7EAE